MAKKTTTIATLASNLSEAKKTLAPITKKLETIAQLISDTEKALGEYQEIADGVIVRKSKVTRVKGKSPGKPATKKKVSGLSGRLKAYRKENGLNQEALAKKLGMNVASVRAWEQGRSNPRKDAMEKIEKVLGGKAAKPKKAAGKVRKTRKTRKVAKAAPKAAEAPPAAAEAPKA